MCLLGELETLWSEQRRRHSTFTNSCYLLIDFNSFLVLLQLSAVVSHLQETFVGRAKSTQNQINPNGQTTCRLHKNYFIFTQRVSS